MKIFGWGWDKGSVCHFLLGLAGGVLGVIFSVLFTGAFIWIEEQDYRRRWARIKQGTDKIPETWERTKQEYFEFFLGLIPGRILLTVATFVILGRAI